MTAEAEFGLDLDVNMVRVASRYTTVVEVLVLEAAIGVRLFEVLA